METIARFAEIFLHLDATLGSVIQQFGVWAYVLLFLIVLCETGLVVTPFLPGDSLLFAAGAFAGTELLDFETLYALFFVAAVVGDAMNYSIGRYVGTWLLRRRIPFLRKEHLEKTQRFYAVYGAKTIVIARFLPIVRTLAPFIAGVGEMRYGQFFFYNVVGAFLWVTLFLGGGYFFGNLPVVKENFEFVIMGIIIVSVLPGVIEWGRAKWKKRVVNPA